MRLIYLGLMPVVLLTGCATNLKPVREFADETKKISVAFNPVINQAVEHCKQQFLQRRIFTTDKPLSGFVAKDAIDESADTCKPIADQMATAKEMSKALSDYAGQLSTLAADGVESSVDDNYDALEKKLGDFQDMPKEKIGAVSSLLKFITRGIVARSQHDAIVDALNHEVAVGALADALVVYSDRVYGAYVKERLKDQPLFADQLRAEAASPISSRLRILDVYQQTLTLQEQHKATVSLHAAVSQMKVSMQYLRQNIDRLSSQERLAEVQKLSKEVRSLYQQLAKAF